MIAVDARVMLIDPSIMALRALTAAELDRCRRALKVDDGWQRFRINPLRFAEREGFASQVAAEMFLHGVKVGHHPLDK